MEEGVEIIERAKQYFRIVRNVAENRELEGELTQLQRSLQKRDGQRKRAQVIQLHLVGSQRSSNQTPTPRQRPSDEELSVAKKGIRALLFNLCLFLCLACLLWSFFAAANSLPTLHGPGEPIARLMALP